MGYKQPVQKKKSSLNLHMENVREDPWRMFRIMAEFVEGFQSLSKVGPAVSIFGSARSKKLFPNINKLKKPLSFLLKKGRDVG